jgi:hypothetical protein
LSVIRSPNVYKANKKYGRIRPYFFCFNYRVTSPSSSSSPSRVLLLAVALLSASILGFEVALTRLFSVLLRYHFAFLVISIALCGLGLGGFGAQYLKRIGKPLSLEACAVGFGVSTALGVLLLLRVVFAFFPESYWLASLLVLVPFTFGGLFLAEAFGRHPAHSGQLYAWDLAGAALAAVGVVGLLQLCGAINASLFAAALGGFVAWLCNRKFIGAPLILLALFGINSVKPILDVPPVPPKPDANEMSLADRGVTQPLFTELGTPGHTSRIIDTRWNAFARTDVVDDTQTPGTLLVYTNGNVPTNMMQWDGDPKKLPALCADFPLTDWVFANAPLKGGDVLAIGPGGGLDALMALRFGARAFEGAEINPSIVGLMNDYRKFNGGIYDRPNVHVRTADGRAAVQNALRAGKKYRLIYSALTKTATAGQGMALLESFIYTQDAFADYWNALDERGQLAIVTDQPALLARLFSTTLAMLQARGIDNKTACRHIALASDPRPGPYRYAFVLSKTPFTSQQTYAQSDSTSSRGVFGIWIPERAAREDFGPYADVASGKTNNAAFVAWWRDKKNIAQLMTGRPPDENTPQLDISPCADNRPFVLDLNVVQPPVFAQLAAFALVLGLVLAALAWSEPKSSVDFDRTSGETKPGLSRAFYTLYFLALGVGFMLVEIPLAQKLILPLGYPTLALTTILFSLLLGGGAGAYLSQQAEGEALRRRAAFCALGVALLTVFAVMALDALAAPLLGLPIVARCIVAGVLLLPFGVLLGTPFPSGMRLFAARYESRVPLVWGLNGVASVVGSLGAAIGAKSMGFNNVLLTGAVVYGIAAALLFAAREK